MRTRSSDLSRLKAVILAGECRTDFGQSLPGIPKLICPFGQRLIYTHMLEFLRKHSISNVLVCLDKRARISTECFETNRNLGMEISYSVADSSQGTAGCLRHFKQFLRNETFLLITGPVLLDFDLEAMLDFHHQMGSLITVGMYKDERCHGFPEVIEIWKGEIESIYSPYPSHAVMGKIRTAGIFVMNWRAFDFIHDESYLDLKEQLIPRIKHAGLKVHPYWINSFCRRIDTPEDYLDLIQPSPVGEGIPAKTLSSGHGESNGSIALEEPLFRATFPGAWRVSVSAFYRRNLYSALKRLIDLTLTPILLLLTGPLWLVIALAIKWDSPGPIFFGQRRCGKSGREFTMLKFRSMVAKAEELKPSLAEENEVDGPMFKMSHDPRLTRIGGFLRDTSLDELPQLLNVLLGHMTLIGPRPLSMGEMRFCPSWRDLRLTVKPGITGLWQIRSRAKHVFRDWIIYDTYYVERQSLSLDCQVLWESVSNFATGIVRAIRVAIYRFR
jgi:lipopolysaccharide/colanic/teichoic acid biosynthesis glycosyltransferase